MEAAPAKVNLHLHVLGRTGSGYHTIDSALAFIDVGDRVSASPAPDLTLSVSGPKAASVQALGSSNLVLRAASELRRRAGISAGAHLHLEKHLPPGAGLAGGTADGAAALRALAGLWGLPRHGPVVRAAARALGADGPACLEMRACRVSGIGADLEFTPPPSGHLLVAWPGIELATSEVYGRWCGSPSRPAQLRRVPLADHLARTRNDLEKPATQLAPVVGTVVRTLASLPGAQAVRMTGSGTAAYALFLNRVQAETAAWRLRRQRPRWWSCAASFLPDYASARRVKPGGRRFALCRMRVHQ